MKSLEIINIRNTGDRAESTDVRLLYFLLANRAEVIARRGLATKQEPLSAVEAREK